MNGTLGRILPLGVDVRASLKASVRISSLNDVVVELVKNALDAQAVVIHVRVDYSKGYCSVVDNGRGIARDEFLEAGGLGRMFYTSKASSDTETYGRHGRSLASIAGVSLLTITSRQSLEESFNTLVLHQAGRVASRLDTEESECLIEGQGTNVSVHDLFSKLPVRVKQRIGRFQDLAEVEKEFETLKNALVGLVLAHEAPFSLDLREIAAGVRYLHRPDQLDVARQLRPSTRLLADRVYSTLRQAGYISRNDRESWREISARTRTVSVKAAISLRPVPTKSIQFMAVQNLPVCCDQARMLYDVVNSAFGASDFPNITNTQLPSGAQTSPVRAAGRHFESQGRSLDRWPTFYIQIDCQSGRKIPEHELLGTIGQESGRLITSMADLLRSLSEEFLRINCFRPRNTRQTGHSNPRPILRDVSSQLRSVTPQPPETLLRLGSSRDNYRQSVLDQVLSSSSVRAETNVKGVCDPSNTPSDDVLEGQQHPINPQPPSASQPESEWYVRKEGCKTCRAGADEAAVPWLESRSGRIFSLNPRTGSLLPSPAAANDSPDESPTLGPPSSWLPVRRTPRQCLQRRNRSVGEVAAALSSEYTSNLFCRSEAPVRSMLPPGGVTSRSALNQDGPKRFDSTQSGQSGRSLSRTGIQRARVIGQVDNKFILAQVSLVCDDSVLDLDINNTSAVMARDDPEEQALVLVDQHAADERYRVEQLYHALCNRESTALAKPIVFEVGHEEAEHYRRVQRSFSEWRVHYDVRSPDSTTEQNVQICVFELPTVVAERCRLEPKCVVDMLRREAWSPRQRPRSPPAKSSAPRSMQPSWYIELAHCPRDLIELVNSRACRSAIMFNDELSQDQCEELVHRLARCVLPFQCAHGRPSVSIAAPLNRVPVEVIPDFSSSKRTFGEAWSNWGR